jgi:hypothetical protein
MSIYVCTYVCVCVCVVTTRHCPSPHLTSPIRPSQSLSTWTDKEKVEILKELLAGVVMEETKKSHTALLGKTMKEACIYEQ